MPTGRSIVSTCPARAALAGNPSDGYGGAVVAIPIPDLTAMASATEADEPAVLTTDPELRRLLDATVTAFTVEIGPLPPLAVSASTTIPRSVGLAGSSALIIAALRVLAAWTGHRWEPMELARIALAIERDRLGVEAGLQDRLVQAIGTPVAMTFDPVGYERLELPEHHTLFVAWQTDAGEPSGVLHRSLRRRFDAGDPPVVVAMRSLAVQAGRARRGIEVGDAALLADAMDASFDLRASIVDVGDRQRRLVDIGRRGGAAVNSAGSGGSVVGLARRRVDLPRLQRAYESAGATFLGLG
jgi:glucuronokinase